MNKTIKVLKILPLTTIFLISSLISSQLHAYPIQDEKVIVISTDIKPKHRSVPGGKGGSTTLTNQRKNIIHESIKEKLSDEEYNEFEEIYLKLMKIDEDLSNRFLIKVHQHIHEKINLSN